MVSQRVELECHYGIRAQQKRTIHVCWALVPQWHSKWTLRVLLEGALLPALPTVLRQTWPSDPHAEHIHTVSRTVLGIHTLHSSCMVLLSTFNRSKPLMKTREVSQGPFCNPYRPYLQGYVHHGPTKRPYHNQHVEAFLSTMSPQKAHTIVPM